MAKYIIDIANDDYLVSLHGVGSCSFKKVTDLEPYTASESYIDGLKKGQDEAWKFAKLFMDDMGVDDLEVVNGDTIKRYFAMSYQEAKAKYAEYKKKKEQIRVGDEVIIKSDGVKGVVLDEDLCGEFSVFTENGCCEAYRKIHFEKTGRHLDGVEKLLEEMRSDS